MYQRKSTVKVMLDDGAFVPVRAHSDDAGMDLLAMSDFDVPPYGRVVHDTGVHVAIPRGYVGDVKSKSGLMTKHGITTDGTVDCGFTGSIRVTLFNNSSVRFEVKRGNKIAQLVIKQIITPDVELVDSLEDTERGANGFGSTGK